MVLTVCLETILILFEAGWTWLRRPAIPNGVAGGRFGRPGAVQPAVDTSRRPTVQLDQDDESVERRCAAGPLARALKERRAPGARRRCGRCARGRSACAARRRAARPWPVPRAGVCRRGCASVPGRVGCGPCRRRAPSGCRPRHRGRRRGIAARMTHRESGRPAVVFARAWRR